jgi:hypothetical protein
MKGVMEMADKNTNRFATMPEILKEYETLTKEKLANLENDMPNSDLLSLVIAPIRSAKTISPQRVNWRPTMKVLPPKFQG